MIVALHASVAREGPLDAALNVAEDRFVPPPILEALYHRPADGFNIGLMARGDPGGRRWYGRAAVEDMQGLALADVQRRPITRDHVRRAEIVEADRAWHAAGEAADRAVGLSEAKTAAYAEWQMNRDLRARIAAMPPRTLDGIMIKVRVAVECFDGVDGLEDHMQGEFGPAPTSGEGLVFVVLRDLMGMMGRGGA